MIRRNMVTSARNERDIQVLVKGGQKGTGRGPQAQSPRSSGRKSPVEHDDYRRRGGLVWRGHADQESTVRRDVVGEAGTFQSFCQPGVLEHQLRDAKGKIRFGRDPDAHQSTAWFD